MDTQLVAFLILATVLIVTPGADMALVTRNAVARGRRAAWYTTLGIGLGCIVHAVASSLGLSVLLATSATAFHGVKLVGAAYLTWLGITTLVRTFRGGAAVASQNTGEPADTTSIVRPERLRKSFIEGLVTNLLNPKVALFYLMLLPQFIAPGQNVLWRSLMLAGLHIGMGVAWLTVYAAAIDQLRNVLTRSNVRRWFERAMGGCLVLLGARLAVQKLDTTH